MSEIISKSDVGKIVKKYSQSITPKTSQQEMLKIIGDIVYEAIKSINKESFTDETFLLEDLTSYGPQYSDR